MVSYDSMKVHQGSVGILLQCLDFSKKEAFRRKNVSMSEGAAIRRADKIAQSALDEFEKRFTEKFDGIDRASVVIYCSAAENKLFLRSHIVLLIDILLGKVDPEPKESIPPSHLPDRA